MLKLMGFQLNAYLVATLLLSASSLRYLKLLYQEFRPSSLPRYQHGRRPAWALVTGASDGIGFGFVTELASQGFNVIMHGRNKAKIDQLIAKLQKDYPDRSFRSLIVDASRRDDWHKLEDFAKDLLDKEINLTVLINNVGGGKLNGGPAFLPTDGPSASAVNELIDMNAVFPVQITRAVLPILKKTQPSLVITVGSVTGIMAFPYLASYGASKSFNAGWSNGLRLEMQMENLDIEVFSVLTGKVQTAGTRDTPVTMFVPSSQQYAKSALRKVGAGEPTVYGYWGHAIQIEFFALIPRMLRDRILISVAKDEINDERKSS